MNRSSSTPPSLVAQHAVLGAALRNPADVVGDQALEALERLRSAGQNLAHVGDVEDADAGPDGDVLLADPGVLDRHLPAGERHQLRPCGEVRVVQGSNAEVLGSVDSHLPGYSGRGWKNPWGPPCGGHVAANGPAEKIPGGYVALRGAGTGLVGSRSARSTTGPICSKPL